MADVQGERAYQRQDALPKVPMTKPIKKKGKGMQKRWAKNIGLGFKTPKSAKDGSYIDKKCPFTGSVSIRGRILRGVVSSNKMKRTIIVRREYFHFVRKYDRYEKRHKNVPAHCSPCFQVNPGDVVTIGECRPLSKTVRFNVIKVNRIDTMARRFTKF